MRLSLARGCQQIINNHVKGELKFRSTISLCFCETFKNYLLFYPSPFTSVRSYRLSLSLHVWTEVAAVHLTLETIEVELTLAGRTTGCRARAGRWAGQQCTAPAGLIRETVTNVTAIDTWRPYHALHTARCPNNLQLSCGYPAWLAFQVITNVMTYHSWQQNCFEHLHWIVKLPASILVTVWATEEQVGLTLGWSSEKNCLLLP